MISSELPKNWILSIVYNGQRVGAHRKLRRELSGISILNLPWLIMGDFNAICSASEHKGSFSHYEDEANCFLNFIASNLLLDLGYVGWTSPSVMDNWGLPVG